MRQIDDAARLGRTEERPGGLVSWAESQKLPYLDACIREAFRLHPAAGLLLERIVPPNGADICGEHIAAGTIVGCNAWVIHRRSQVFGDDVEAYRPERWLEVSKEKRKEMNGTMLQFGMGSRTCIRKNISLLEMYKLVRSFLRRFEVSYRVPSTSLLWLTSYRSTLPIPAESESCIILGLSGSWILMSCSELEIEASQDREGYNTECDCRAGRNYL